MIRVVLFDLDGVLVETRDLHYRAFNTALIAHGCEAIKPLVHEMVFNGLPTAAKLDTLVRAGSVRAEDVASIAALKQKETRRLLEVEVKFDPAVYCLVAGLAAKGYGVGVVSNAVRGTVETILWRLEIYPDLDVIVTNEDGAPKPAPDLYLTACRRIDLPPAECLAVEDGEYGVRAATAAGCKVLRVTCPADVTPKLVWENLC